MVSSNDKTVICGNDGLIYYNHCQICIGKYIDQNLKIVSKYHCKGTYLFTTLVSLRMKVDTRSNIEFIINFRSHALQGLLTLWENWNKFQRN